MVLAGTTTTDAAGTYYFDNLSPGQYQVVLPSPAANAPVSSGTTVTVDDNGGDGLDNGTQATSGSPATSPVITLTAGAEPAAAAENNAQETAGCPG